MNAFDRTARCIDHYRELGLCPLPSRMDKKCPMLATYADFYQGVPVPEQTYRVRTTNVQILCGAKPATPTKIVVVDLDGPEAKEVWDKIASLHGYEPGETWIARTGSGGYHHYFTVPGGIDEVQSGLLWALWDTWGDNGKGAWCKHKEIRLLGDNSLVVAPPSLHVETKKPYQFVGDHNPNRVWLPEVAPAWLLALPRLATPRCVADPPKPAYVPRNAPRSGLFYSRDEVLRAVGTSKLAIAKEWGLVTKSDAPNPRGWISCYVPGRENPRHSTPSGSFHFSDGVLQDRKDMTTTSFLDLGVLLQPGRYKDWTEVRDELGDRFLSPGKSPR